MEQDYYGYVYLIYDQKEKKVYIGQTKLRVEKDYYGSGTIIRRIIAKRGTYFLKKIVLGYCYSREEILECETECKYFFNAFDKKYGYNIVEKDFGGDTLTNHPDKDILIEEHRKRIKNRDENKKTSTFKETLKKDPTIIIKKEKKRRMTLLNDPSIDKNRGIKTSLTKINNNTHVGKKSGVYIKLNHSCILIQYFSLITTQDLKNNYYNITGNILSEFLYNKFLNVLNFPISTLAINHPHHRMRYLKFVEENKDKIQWYIDNYERLEEEYYDKKCKIRRGQIK